MTTSISKLFNKTTFVVPESISSSEIPDDSDMDEVLLQKIKKKIGNKCNQYGFIDKDSIKIIERTIGKIKSCHFDGNIHYTVKIEMSICQPTIQSKIKCNVVGKNQAGILCISHPLQIMLPPEMIVEIVKSKIMMNNDSIRVLGKFVSKI